MGKRGTDLDWIVDDSPDPRRAGERAAGGRSAAPGWLAAPRTIRVAAPRRPSFFRRNRRWLLPVGGALLALAVAVYAVYWLGWQRVRASLTEQIVYEDTQAAAGDVDAVLALQAPGDQGWLNWRAALVQQVGLAYLPPAKDLSPLPEPPRLLRLDVAEDGRFDAVVLRDFAGPAGESVSFEYVQRYRQLAPGVWESLPPDTGALVETRQWAGPRLKVTYPVADERWMLANLPKINGYLQAACGDWACPAGLAATAVFLGQLPSLPTTGQPYPAVLNLPSLQLAGYPNDEAASRALIGAITGQLLQQLAVQIGNANRYWTNPYLDALVVRELARLQLSPMPDEPLAPADLAGPEQLWPQPTGGGLPEGGGQRPRQQALRFLNDVATGFPLSAESALVRQTGRAGSLPNWLGEGLAADGQALIDGWLKTAASGLGTAYPANWDALTGLSYTCPSGAWLVRNSQPERLAVELARAGPAQGGHFPKRPLAGGHGRFGRTGDAGGFIDLAGRGQAGAG